MDKLIRLTILGTIAGAILAFNVYHADYKLLVAQIGTIVFFGMWLIGMVDSRFRGNDIEIAGIVKSPLLWFFGICVLSFILSPHKLISGQELYKVGTWVVFGVIVGAVIPAKAGIQRGEDNFINQIVCVWLACAGIVAIYGIVQFFGIDFIRFKLPGGRIVSTFGNATLLAGFLAMTLPVAIAAPSYGANVRKIVHGTLIFVLFLCLVLTKSRAGILAGVIGCALCYVLMDSRFRGNDKGSRLPSVARTLLIGGILLLGISLFLPQIRHIIFEVIVRKTARIDIWKDSVQLIPLQPFFGTGIGTFSSYFPAVVSQSVLKLHPIEWEFVNHAHSEYLEILIEMGAVGLVVFLAVVFCVMRKVLNVMDSRFRGNDMIGLFAAFITVLIYNIVSVDLRYTSTGMFFWMIGGMFSSVIPAKAGIQKEMDPRFHGDDKGSRRTSSLGFARDFLRSLARMILVGMIITAAISAIYFTVKPYMNIQQIREQQFFVKDMSEIDRKIEEVVDSRFRGNDIEEAKDYFELGVLYAKRQDFDKAKECFIKTIRLDYKHAGAFNNLGNVAAVDEDFGRARALFHKAVRIEPKNVEYLVNFAYACFKVNVMYEAAGAVEKALSLDPNNSRARLLRRQMGQ